MLGDLFLGDVRHHGGKGVQTTHTVVVASLVNGIVTNYDGNIIIHDPLFFKVLCEN